ncbi:uncharacterized protein LOC124894759 [Capsicum annuum]|uniref:uncharacterized protein LOC124894759 n=1 Tax=Capsicum annuum TaxID=4072 RepID=UPI001FB10741|nr:uncharacterized protein LOC124894759 [Capsicum annuum]
MSSSSFITYSENDYRYCKCGHQALLKTSWTQQNPGRRFSTCKLSKKLGGCDNFHWYEERHPSQANRVIWGLLKKVKPFEENQNRARILYIIGVISTALLLLGIWMLKPNC